MSALRLLVLGVLLLLGVAGCGGVLADVPGGTVLHSTPCSISARINGIDDPGEWDAATRREVELAMVAPKGGPRPARRSEVRLMNSAAHLYVALRVPDAGRDFSTDPVVSDFALLAFCRGDSLAEGDDRRILLPGLFADKHVTTPGQDADDARRDGQGAMRWRKTATGGEYFCEWQVPLNATDPHDIAVRPGGRVRFNLIYMDRFSFTLEHTEAGGLFGADANDAARWGEVHLAANVGAEAPASIPAWLASRFPHTGEPDRSTHRLRRLAAEEIDVNGSVAGVVTVELSFPGVDGKPQAGKARVFLPPVLREAPSGRVPLIHNAGYELDENGARGLLARGYAVSTPHAHPLNPLGRGVNLDRAIMHAVRALPCIDPLRVSIQGGSAGGWMTLMLTADAFPLVWSAPAVPPIHWGYNAAYISDQRGLAEPPAGSQVSPLPVLRQVVGIADQARNTFGMTWDSPTFLANSPLAHLDTITAPVQVTFSTADMLVPIDQVGRQLVWPREAGSFPPAFSTQVANRFPAVHGNRTLLPALPRGSYKVFVIPAPPGLALAKPGAPAPAAPAKPVAVPFSSEHVWSIAILDEGPCEPWVGHFKYNWPLDQEPFKKQAEARGVRPEQLTPLKLQRLMMRLLGEEWRPFKIRPGNQGPELPGVTLDYPEAERRDVLLGLTAFAAEDARALRLARLYESLPPRLRTLGKSLGDGTAADVRRRLARSSSR